jgi:hypothetical protein
MDSTILAAIITGLITIITAIIGGIFALRKSKKDKNENNPNQLQSVKNIIISRNCSAQSYKIYKNDSTNESKSEIESNSKYDIDNKKHMIIGKDNSIPFSLFIGKQHRILRKNVLGLTIREMADFYGLEKASVLESYEMGTEELPRKYVELLNSFFFINTEYLDKGNSHIFKTIYVFGEQLRVLLSEGFNIFFLVKTKPREGLYTYPILHKVENRYSRVISLNLSSFHSEGGGRYNVENIIRELIKQRIDKYKVPIIQVSEPTWNTLEADTFYCKNPLSLGSSDFECQDIFDKWYSDLVNH